MGDDELFERLCHVLEWWTKTEGETLDEAMKGVQPLRRSKIWMGRDEKQDGRLVAYVWPDGPKPEVEAWVLMVEEMMSKA